MGMSSQGNSRDPKPYSSLIAIEPHRNRGSVETAERETRAQQAARRGEDAALVARVAAGDQAGLAELYDRFSGMLLALIRRILGEGEAEDVLQDTFVQVWNQAQRYDSKRSSVSTWLVLIARSRAIDRLRSRQVSDRAKDASERENPRTDESPKGVGTVLHRERAEKLSRELGNLPEEQRQVLELAFFRGLTQSEIAATTSIPLGTVKTRTLLAMKKLRKALEAEIDDLL